MLFNYLSKVALVVVGTLFLGACATQQAATTKGEDAYTGTETVKYLADGVPDRVFFSTNKSELTSAASANLAKQAAYLKANPNLNVVLEGHADERGTREYNLALGQKRAIATKDFLVSNGVAANRIKVISYGKEKPANPASNVLAWSQNRRAVTIKIN
jgi:peptidoglycan-associated lipoprotein